MCFWSIMKCPGNTITVSLTQLNESSESPPAFLQASCTFCNAAVVRYTHRLSASGTMLLVTLFLAALLQYDVTGLKTPSSPNSSMSGRQHPHNAYCTEMLGSFSHRKSTLIGCSFTLQPKHCSWDLQNQRGDVAAKAPLLLMGTYHPSTLHSYWHLYLIAQNIRRCQEPNVKFQIWLCKSCIKRDYSLPASWCSVSACLPPN